MIQSTTQNAPTHHKTKRRYKKDRETKRQDQRDGRSSNSHKDQDSDVSFENDSEEEIDTTEIEEEEDWIEYKKEAQTLPLKRWERRRFDAGTRLTKN